MSTRFFSWAVVLGLAVMLGCDDTKKSDHSADQTKETTVKPDAAQPAVPETPAAVAPTAPAVPATPPAAVENAVDEIKAQATTLIGELKTAVENRKWSDAKEIIKKLEAMKDKLTSDQTLTLENLKKVVDAANLPFFNVP